MRWALKIILFPIILILSILIAFLKFIIKVSGMILGIISFLVFIGAVKILVMAVGAGLGAWGVINLMEGYGNDNPGAKCSCTVRKQATENKR